MTGKTVVVRLKAETAARLLDLAKVAAEHGADIRLAERGTRSGEASYDAVVTYLLNQVDRHRRRAQKAARASRARRTFVGPPCPPSVRQAKSM